MKTIVQKLAGVRRCLRPDAPSAARRRFLLDGFVAILPMLAVTALVLLAMGRMPWYQHGPIAVWSGDASGPDTSQQFTDPYTFTHVTHGVLLYLALHVLAGRLPRSRRISLAVAAECGWEILENTAMVIRRYREMTMALGYYGDSVINSMGDILACTAGFLLAARLPVRVTVMMIVLLELALTLWIRDSLLLNIVMLAYPIESVRNWQLGR